MCVSELIEYLQEKLKQNQLENKSEVTVYNTY